MQNLRRDSCITSLMDQKWTLTGTAVLLGISMTIMAFIACMSGWSPDIYELVSQGWTAGTDGQTRQTASKRTNERANTGYEFSFDQQINITFFSFLASRMAIYLRREPKTRLWGILFGFQLSFNKRGECCCVLMKNTFWVECLSTVFQHTAMNRRSYRLF